MIYAVLLLLKNCTNYCNEYYNYKYKATETVEEQ